MTTPNQFTQGFLALLAPFVVGWHLPTPSACWTAFKVWRSTKGFPMTTSNPIALMGAALKLGQDGVRFYTDLTGKNKADAVAAVLDALPALATVTGEPLVDLQAVVTADALGYAWDLEQDLVGVLPALSAALAKYRNPAAPAA